MDTKNMALISELRTRGLPPKAIARQLGLRPTEVSAVIREEAARLAPQPDPGALPAMGPCFISPGWSSGLGFSGPAAEWLAHDTGLAGAEGLVCVLWTRAHRYGKLSACGCLVDVFCLGVKNAMGPKVLETAELHAFVARYFSPYDAPPVPVPFALIQNLTLGAVDYAGALGFSPHPDFAAVRPSLGEWTGPSPIRFGKDGRPVYIEGPDDDSYAILDTLRLTTGGGAGLPGGILDVLA